MFFILSKVFYFLILPFSWIGISFVWSLLTKNPRLKRKLRVGCLVLGLLFSNNFIASRCLRILESKPVQITQSHEIAVVLSGITRHGMDYPSQFHLSEGADRIIEAVRLYKQGKIEKILISGGAADLSSPNENEGLILSRLALDLGLDANDLIVENNSRNTYENAAFSSPMLKKHQSIVLVTSAFHMPRAVRCFKKQGLIVTAYPVDFQTATIVSFADFVPSSTAFRNWNILIKEIVGLTAYKLVGYI